MRVLAIAIFAALLAGPTLGSTVWIGAGLGPGKLVEAFRIVNGVADLGTEPTNAALAVGLVDLLGDPDTPSTATALRFEEPTVPANVCEETKCETVGANVCAKKPGWGSKGSSIFADHCVTACAPTPVKTNAAVVWVAIECP